MLLGASQLNNYVTIATAFIEPNNYGYFDAPPLQGFIYEDVFDKKFFNILKNNIHNTLELSNKNTFFTHNTIFKVDDSERKIISHNQNAREQNVIFDLTFDPEWYYQNPDTIKAWSAKKIQETVSPIFQKCVQKIESLPPACENINDFIFYRCHINYLATNKYLTLHFDGNPILFNLDVKKARIYSFTFYLYDHIEGMGGEIWSINGFSYKPRENSAILINGNQTMHGVTMNTNNEPRLAFTMRFAHKDDLLLLGHPDKYLYNVRY